MIVSDLSNWIDTTEADALPNDPADAANLLMQQLSEARAEVARLRKENRRHEIKANHSLANNLCADHRDKQGGKGCLACDNEQLRAACTWQSIEAAPTMGRGPILLWREGMDFPQLAFSDTWWQGGFSHGSKPTHWMPLRSPETQ